MDEPTQFDPSGNHSHSWSPQVLPLRSVLTALTLLPCCPALRTSRTLKQWRLCLPRYCYGNGASLQLHSNYKKDLEAKGRLQGYLRCQAANELRKQPVKYRDACPSGIENFAKPTSTAGVWVNAVSLHALACSLHCQFRVWTWGSQMSKWLLYMVGPPCSKKQKNCNNPAVIWLHLCNHHYTWPKPKGSDWALDRLVPSQAVRTYEDPTPS